MQLELPLDYPTAQPIVVAFCGFKGHGKDTAAEVLTESLGFEHLSFATGLRRTVATALRVNERYFTNPETKEEIDPRTGKARRYWLQYIGTEGFRHLWNEIWTWWWSEEIKERAMPRVVTTDVRFPNEEEEVRKFPRSILIRVENPRIPPSGDLHESEQHIPYLQEDYIVTNDGSIEDLRINTLEVVCRHFNISPIQTRPDIWENI